MTHTFATSIPSYCCHDLTELLLNNLVWKLFEKGCVMGGVDIASIKYKVAFDIEWQQ